MNDKTTGKYTPRPYFNALVDEELDREDKELAAQNLKDEGDTGSAGQATHQNQRATSDGNLEDTTYEKRWRDLKKHYDTEVTKLRDQLKELQENKTSFKPPKTEEELAAFRNKYPEFYDVMLSVAHQNSSSLVSKTDSRVQELEAKLAEAEQEKAFKEIEKAHPDYVSVVNAQEFLTWLEDQDTTVQSWVKSNSNNARAFIRALDLYKLDAGLAKPQKRTARGSSNETSTSNSSAAQDVRVKSQPTRVGDTNQRTWSRAEIDRMHPDEFEKHEEDIMNAMREGRVL
jgi:hypothetical protein